MKAKGVEFSLIRALYDGGWTVSSPELLIHRFKGCQYPLNSMRAGSRAGLGILEKKKFFSCRNSNDDLTAIQPVVQSLY